MADRDLTPAEARAEIEAFMGEGWVCGAYGGSIQWAEAEFRPDDNVSGPNLSCGRATYREAVDALKAAWRDAVRPWVVLAADRADMECGFGATDGNTRERLVARVLKEESK